MRSLLASTRQVTLVVSFCKIAYLHKLHPKTPNNTGLLEETQMPQSISCTNPAPALSGGYISIRKDGNEIHIVSVPSFVFGSDRYRDSVSQNDDEFEDDEGNGYSIGIVSSNVGVDCELTISAKNGSDKDLARRIEMIFQGNEY